MQEQASAAVEQCLSAASTSAAPEQQQRAWQTLACIAHSLALRGSPALVLQPVFQHLDEGSPSNSMAKHSSQQQIPGEPAAELQPGAAVTLNSASSAPSHGHSAKRGSQQQEPRRPAAEAQRGAAAVLSGALGALDAQGLTLLSRGCHARVRACLGGPLAASVLLSSCLTAGKLQACRAQISLPSSCSASCTCRLRGHLALRLQPACVGPRAVAAVVLRAGAGPSAAAPQGICFLSTPAAAALAVAAGLCRPRCGSACPAGECWLSMLHQ